MILQTFLFGLVMATLLGSGYHLLAGGSFNRLLLGLALAQAGFWLGHLLGGSLGWTFFNVGALNLGMAILGCAALLGFEWFTRIKIQQED